jgi:2-haloacid dehalogenase
MPMLDFKQFEVLTFDCYGTLIDWETGILSALKSVVRGAGRPMEDDEILSIYADIETGLETGEYRSYKETLRNIISAFGERLGFDPDSSRRERLVTSLPGWPAFADTVVSLQALKNKYKLAIISNTDDDLFEQTAKKLVIKFDWVITAEQVGAYKPSLKNFEYALNTIGVPKDRILHVAQSVYHDIVPASKLGLATVWVNRRKGQQGSGATKAAHGKPDLEVPDLAALVEMMGL